MSNTNWWFLYQQRGGEEDWKLDQASKRVEIIQGKAPAFVTVLDLSGIPTDHDWSKVKYRGPLYFDFDADGDIELVCTQFKKFLAKLEDEFDFDLTQARLFASGGKGFHIEVPEECFMPKIPAAGTSWLPFVYRKMAEAVVVDTLDDRVYTGKRGRMWRTPGVKRENGNYKVPITLAEANDIDPDSYAELIAAPREQYATTPPSCNPKLSLLFENCREKVVSHMRGAKKRKEKASVFLDPWKRAKKTPPTIERLMAGENVAEGAGFQALSMQLSIYATAVGMELEEFLTKTRGLCEAHVSDSSRYGSFNKRQEELARMWRYMESDSMYEFDVAPIAKLVAKGTATPDLGLIATEDKEEPQLDQDGDPIVDEDTLKGVRKGFRMSQAGMFRVTGDVTEVLCRTSFYDVVALQDVEGNKEFRGYSFSMKLPNERVVSAMLTSDAFVSSVKIKQFFAAHQISFQGGDADVQGLLDVMATKANQATPIFVYPREGMFVIDHPMYDTPKPVTCFLTSTCFFTSADPEEKPFTLKYRPVQALSAYNIDIDKAPDLKPEHKDLVYELFNLTRTGELADLLGWFVACHYHSHFLKLFGAFPLLQVYGEAGAGKTQTVKLLAHLHWFMNDISIKSAASCTPFALDAHASSSTSAPLIMDEYKPRELKAIKGRYEKFKDLLKMAYNGHDIGERGTLNRGAETNLAVIKSRATAPICFMSEAIEMETAIIERSVTVCLSKSYQNRQRKESFKILSANTKVLSAIGRSIIENGLSLDLERFSEEFASIIEEIEARLPSVESGEKRIAERMIHNRGVVVMGLRILKAVLHQVFGEEFDDLVDTLCNAKRQETQTEETRIIAAMGQSEASKALSRMATLSRDVDAPWELKRNRDYTVEGNRLELKVERAYDCYRRYCASVNDQPLFDSMDTFLFAMDAYSPVVDKICAQSPLRDEGSNERIVCFDIKQLQKEGVRNFRN